MMYDITIFTMVFAFMKLKANFLAVLTAFALSTEGAHAQSVNLGMSAPLSGSNAALGKEISEGALAYFRKINSEGGIQGRTINLVVMDDKNDRATAGANSRKLLTEQKAIGLFGFASATLTLDAISVAQNRPPLQGDINSRRPC